MTYFVALSETKNAGLLKRLKVICQKTLFCTPGGSIVTNAKWNQKFLAPLPEVFKHVHRSMFTEACPIDFDRFPFSSTMWITVSFERLLGAKSLQLHIVLPPIAKLCSNNNCHGNAVYTIEQSCHAGRSVISLSWNNSLAIVSKGRELHSAKINTLKACYSNGY